MDNKKETPVCLITGGTSGIGLASVRLFSQHGFRVATCGRDANRLAETEALLAAIGGEYLVHAADLAQPQAATELLNLCAERFGRVDVLLNNAAVAPLANLEDVSQTEFEAAIAVNINAVFKLTQACWPIMKRQGSGTVINISSLAAIDPFPGFSVYGATKAWVDTFTKAIASEGKECGIRVFSIRPGAVETPMLRGLFPEFPKEQCVQPEDVANLAWQMVTAPENFESGNAYNCTNQPV